MFRKIIYVFLGFFATDAWWTLKFYKHRQRKWQKIAKSL